MSRDPIIMALRLERGKVERCSIEWLIRHVHRLGGSVHITVTLGDVAGAWRLANFQRAHPPRSTRRR